MSLIRRVLLVDDHPLVRQGMRTLIDATPDLRVCAEATDRTEALAAVARHTPHVALVDLSLQEGSGLDLLKELSTRHPELPLLVVSMQDEALYAERALRAGAKGYVGKHESGQTLLAAIKTVLKGGIHLSPDASTRLLRALTPGPRQTEQPASLIERLSDRELVVFELIGRGRRTGEIARELHVSVKTVDAYRAHIKRKLGLRSGVELVQHAGEWVRSRGRPG